LLAGAARQHWLLTLLLMAGLVMRILVQIAYRPALFYIDTIKYLYGAYPGNDPPGYQLFLKVFLAAGNLDMVAGLQHLLGLGIAIALYALLLRRGAPRWISALATAPVLLDAYQLQLEQTVMPDILFEALMVAGIVVLLWRNRPPLWALAVAGLLLGATAPMWQPGEILILPAVIYAAIMATGWRARVGHAALIAVAFAIPIIAVSFRNELVLHRFSLAPAAGSTIYGRMAVAADCATLKLPAYERPLCIPHAEAVKWGPDNLDHASYSPLKHIALPYGMAEHAVATDFSKRVLEQQPLRVAGSILGDAMKLFEVHRVQSPGDTPIWRWQFQTHFPTYVPYVTVQHGLVQFAYQGQLGLPVVLGNGLNFGGGPPKVIKPVAHFLRVYQLNGGYTPGPLFLFTLIAGLAGSAFLLLRRRLLTDRDWQAARACAVILASGLTVLLLSDAFEFSWRYQLPAVVTLPPAGALGITVIIGLLRGRPGAATAEPATATGPAAEDQGQGTQAPVASANGSAHPAAGDSAAGGSAAGGSAAGGSAAGGSAAGGSAGETVPDETPSRG
jgi:hypothetical protein